MLVAALLCMQFPGAGVVSAQSPASPQAVIGDLAGRIVRSEISRVQVLFVRGLTPVAVSPETLEGYGPSVFTIRDLRKSSYRTGLLAAFQGVQIEPHQARHEVRWMMVFYDTDGQRIASISMQMTGPPETQSRAGFVDNVPVLFPEAFQAKLRDLFYLPFAAPPPQWTCKTASSPASGGPGHMSSELAGDRVNSVTFLYASPADSAAPRQLETDYAYALTLSEDLPLFAELSGAMKNLTINSAGQPEKDGAMSWGVVLNEAGKARGGTVFMDGQGQRGFVDGQAVNFGDCGFEMTRWFESRLLPYFR